MIFMVFASLIFSKLFLHCRVQIDNGCFQLAFIILFVEECHRAVF